MTQLLTQGMISELVELSERYRDQARRCADSEAYEAAVVMIGSAIETMLFTTVAMSQHVVEPADNWPFGDWRGF